MATRNVEVFGSSSERKRLELEDKITFKEYKYRCYSGVTQYRVSTVCWDVCIWLTSFPAELQEIRDFRSDSAFCNYSMDIITVESSGRIKAIVRKRGADGFFSVEGKCLKDVFVLVSEGENKAKSQHSMTSEQHMNTKTEDKPEITGASPPCTENKPEDPSFISGENESNSYQEDYKTVIKQTKPSAYKMTSRPRGVCMIINNEDFHSLTEPSKLEKRHGAQQDVEKLSKMFTRLQFKVVLFKNLRDNEVVMTAKHMSLADHTDYDSFVCCILSHGTQGSVYGVNHVAVPISEVLSQFRSRACHTLAGKPKLFFIQACQGLEPQIGVAVTDTPVMPQPAKLAADGTDFLVAYSTEPGYVAFRHRESGSYFIDALVKNLEGLPGYSLHDVMAKVCSDVSQLNINNGFKQVPQFTSTLTRQLILCSGSFHMQDESDDERNPQENTRSSTQTNTATNVSADEPTNTATNVSADEPISTKKTKKSTVCVMS